MQRLRMRRLPNLSGLVRLATIDSVNARRSIILARSIHTEWQASRTSPRRDPSAESSRLPRLLFWHACIVCRHLDAERGSELAGLSYDRLGLASGADRV